MNWSDERYVRLYTRDTTNWCMWSWQAQSLFPLILRKLDRAGRLDLGKHGRRGLLAHVRMPWEHIEIGLDDLLRDGCIELHQDEQILVMPNYIEAQEARTSDKERQRSLRERMRDLARYDLIGPHPSNGAHVDVTNRDQTSHAVTGCHTPSQAVTPYRTVPSHAYLEDAPKNSKRKGSRDKRVALLSKHREVAERLWTRQDELRSKVIPGSRPLTRTDAALSAVAERLEEGHSEADCDHVLRHYATACRKDAEQRRWFNGETNWREANFRRALGQPADDFSEQPSFVDLMIPESLR